MTQRQLQKNLQKDYSLQKIAFLSLVIGCLVSAVGVEFLIVLIVRYSLSIGFLVLGMVLLISLLPFTRFLLTPATAILVFILFPHQTLAYVYKTAMSDEPRTSFNLANNSLSEDERFITNNVMCGFFKKDPNKGLLPDLAESWDSLPDNKKFVLRLRKDRKDSDGKVINADYVVEALRRLIQISKSEKKDLRGFKWIRGYSKCTIQSCRLEGIQRKDDYVVVIELERPWPNFIGLLEKEAMVIYRSSGDQRKTPISCGSYKISEHDSKHFLLTAVDKTSPGPSRFRIDFLNPETAYQKFCKGEINDLLFFMPSKDDLARHGCNEKDYAFHEVSTSGVWFIHLATPRLQKDKGLHQQLIGSLNVDRFRETWGFKSKQHDSILPQEFGQFGSYQKASWKKKSGFVATQPLVVEYIAGTPQAQALEAALKEWAKEAQVTFKIVAKPFTEFVRDLIDRKADLFVYAELANDSNPIHYISFFYETVKAGLPTAEVSALNREWESYLGDMSPLTLTQLHHRILDSQYFVPMFVMKRPLVVLKPYFLKEYSDFGLANLSIESFQVKREGSVD